MQFEQTNDKGENFTLLYPSYEENEALKKAADEVGARNALQFDRKERAYRLYEAKVPENVDVDKVFGKYATEEAKAASVAERESVDALKKSAARATGTEIDESKIYYPAKGNGDKDAFMKLRQETGASRQGGFVHKDGPTEGFERFQTPEAKKAWQEEYGKVQEASRKRRENAAEGIDVMAERANGRVFLADNSQGFLLPSKKQEAARSAQIEAMKGASNEELTQVFKITEAAKNGLDRKLYGIQLNAAKERGVEQEAFNKMKPEERRKASDFKGLDKAEFSKLVSLTSGFFEARQEMVGRGLLETRESAREMQKGSSQTAGAAGGKQEEKTQESANQAESKQQSKPGNRMAAQLAAGAEAQGVGR